MNQMQIKCIFMLSLTMIPMNDVRVNVTLYIRRRLSRRYVESINKCAFAGIEICIAQITGGLCTRRAYLRKYSDIIIPVIDTCA